jgi:endoglucanase
MGDGFLKMTTGRGELWGVRAVAAIVLLALAAGCGITAAGGGIGGRPAATTEAPSSSPASPATSAAPSETSWPTEPPPDDQPFYVDPTSPAVRQEIRWRAVGRTQDADQIAKISRQPQGIWLTSDPGRVEQEARSVAQGAAAAGRTPVVVLYDLPHRDCDGYSSGGAPNADAYRYWVSRVVRGLGRSAPVVILEPDGIALAMEGCLSDQQRTERYGLLSDAVDALVGQDDAQVYLDAGNPGWVQDPAALAGALRSSGIDRAAGFALNVSNFYTTQSNTEYGHRVATALGGAHFVIDTSRNGNGPATGGNGGEAWCNPPGRALGIPPTIRTGDPTVDAFLWVKDPGESDGACRPGAPAAGQWWPEYALDLASASD